MSKDKKQGSHEKKPIILEAEVVEEEREASSETTENRSHTAYGGDQGTRADGEVKSMKSKKSFGTIKVSFPWMIVVILTAFIGGLYFFPKFEKSLISLGVMESPGQQKILVPVDKGYDIPLISQQDIDAIKADLQRIDAHVQGMNEQSNQTAPDLVKYNERLMGLERSIKQIVADLSILAQKNESVGQTLPSASEDIPALKQQVTQLMNDYSRLAQLIDQGEMSSSSSNQTVTELQGSLALARAENQQIRSALEVMQQQMNTLQYSSVQSNPRGRLILMVSTLRRQILRGDDYSLTLKALRPDIQTLQTVDQVAALQVITAIEQNEMKVKTVADLKESFLGMAVAIKKRQADTEGSFFGDLLTIRKTGSSAEGVDKILNRAELALYGGDLDSAMKILNEDMPADILGAAAPWLAEAEAHHRINKQVNALVTIIAGRVSTAIEE
ncbi:hypothetical protein QGN29_05100 [Temperatibacter marinus]|uniref:Uncharacterized protein n=1 Tax=Temperatibacter marinus TaxID=1456591 RepID=A0AA52EIG5_9PROT|nr:hypothetical protein [Temperatibacter marinus]WND03753.1 hypothetical protein QGN29_05100 [Temperatibacter marinus]